MSDRSRGFSLVELMIAMVIGLAVLGSVVTIFIGNSRTLEVVNQTARQTENGRYAMQILGEDIRMAGYFGEFDKFSTLTTAPDPCATAAQVIAAPLDHLSMPIQGYNNIALTSAPTCLTDVKANTDVLVVRRASTEANCTAGGSIPCFQASLCNDANASPPSELGTGQRDDAFVLSNTATDFTKHKRNCTTPADLRQMLVHLYFIANNSVSGDGIPTLKRWTLGVGIEPLVEGIENLQVEYGIDTSDDGSPEGFTTAVETFNSCVASACAVENWQNITAIKVHLLSRDIKANVSTPDAKQYALGSDTICAASGTGCTGTYDPAYRHHAYSGLFVVKNVAGRRE